MFEKILFYKKIFSAASVVTIVFLIALIGWLAIDAAVKIKEGRAGQAPDTIVVSAKGEVFARPDLAVAVFSVVNEAKTVEEAISENAEKMNAVTDFLKNQGVEDKDLKTINFNIYPRYEWVEDKTCFPPCPSGKRVLLGYEVNQSLEVKIRDLTKVGALIQGAAERGVNQIGNLQFTVDKQDELKNQARAEAIEKAKAKAESLALQLGIELERIVGFSESAAIPLYFDYEKAYGGGIGGEESAPQVEAGENKIEVTVFLTYEIE